MKENKAGATVVSAYGYTVNSLGQRTDVSQTGTAFPATRSIAITRSQTNCEPSIWTKGLIGRAGTFPGQKGVSWGQVLHCNISPISPPQTPVSHRDSPAVGLGGYLENGAVTAVTTNNGADTTSYTYDKMGRTLATTLPDDTITHIEMGSHL